MSRGRSESASIISRRLFAQRFATAAAVSVLPATTVMAEQKPEPDFGEKPDDLTIEDWQEAQARYDNLLRVYGGRLSAEEKHHAVRILIANQHMLASVRSFKVQNSDPSATTLRVVS